MQINVALRGRTRVAALLRDLEQEADHKDKDRGPRCDRRNRRTWRQMILGVLVAHSTRLVALGRVVAPQRRVSSVKAAAMALTYFLQTARVPVPALSTRLLEAAVRQLNPEHLVTYQGKVLLVLDPTEYEQRSRERGKCGRQMEHMGRVRRSKSRPPTKQSKSKGPRQAHGTGAPAQKEDRRTATTPGYVDIWAGLVLKGKRFLPLARQLFSSRHPQRKEDVQEATVNFVEAVPLEGPTESLILATTVPVDTVAQVRAIVRLYAQRWAIETGFETMHAWGQEAFMARRWIAIERLSSRGRCAPAPARGPPPRRHRRSTRVSS